MTTFLTLVSWSVVVVPPVEEPITLQEAKLRAGLDWPYVGPDDPHDVLMRDFIAAARAQVELDTGLALLTQTRDAYYYTAADGVILLPSQTLPLQEVVIPATVVEVVDNVTLWVERRKVGWLDAATLRAEAPLLSHACGLLTAHRATLGRDLAISGAVASINRVPEGYAEAIAPYRLLWVV